jgi:hypothetical protein
MFLTYTQTMTRPRCSTVVFMVAGLCLVLGDRISSQASRGTRERSLYVSVVDSNGAPVPDLGPSDFLVKEDNLTREVLRVTPATDPMQIALLVDTSQAARDAIQHIRLALPPFVAEMTKANAAGKKNEVAVFGVGERPTILAEYSTDARQLQKGIDRIWSLNQSGMYLLDAIIEVSQGLKKREAGRPVIIAIVTAGPEFSNRHHDQVLTPVKSIGAALYVMALGQPDTSLSDESRERAQVFDEGTRDTGGSHEQVLSAIGLPNRMATLAAQLNHQYKVTYGRPESLIPPEKITVAAVKSGLVARGTPVKEGQP